MNAYILSDLEFADNVYIVARTTTELKSKIEELSNVSKRSGLSINYEKTNILTNSEKLPTEI